MEKEKKKKPYYLIVVGIALIIMYFVFKDSLEDILVEIKNIELNTIFKLMILGFIPFLIEPIIIKMLLKDEKDLTYRKALSSTFNAWFYRGVTFGTGTQIAQVAFLKGNNISVGKSMSALTFMYLFQKIAVVIMGLLGFFINKAFIKEVYASASKYILLTILLAFLIAVFLVLLNMSKKFHELLVGLLRKISKKENYQEKIDKLENEFTQLREESKFIVDNKKLIALAIGLQMVKLLQWYMVPYVLIKATGKSLAFVQVVGTMAIVMMIIGVIPSTGGVGSTEFAFILLFTQLIGAVKAKSYSLIYRAVTFYYPFLLGMIYMIMYRLITTIKVKHS